MDAGSRERARLVFYCWNALSFVEEVNGSLMSHAGRREVISTRGFRRVHAHSRETVTHSSQVWGALWRGSILDFWPRENHPRSFCVCPGVIVTVLVAWACHLRGKEGL